MSRRSLAALASLVAGVGSLGASPASALLIGDFEAGSFDGWATTGETYSIGAVLGISPTSGTGMLALGTGTGSTLDGGPLDAFFGFANGTIDLLSPNGNNVTEGSGATLVISGNAGEMLTYDLNFLTSETLFYAPDYRDFTFSTIRSGEEGEVVRDDAWAMTRLPTTNATWLQSGWQSFNYTFVTTGTFTIGFGMVDVCWTTPSAPMC
jgi:hypothetical protein